MAIPEGTERLSLDQLRGLADGTPVLVQYRHDDWRPATISHAAVEAATEVRVRFDEAGPGWDKGPDRRGHWWVGETTCVLRPARPVLPPEQRPRLTREELVEMGVGTRVLVKKETGTRQDEWHPAVVVEQPPIPRYDHKVLVRFDEEVGWGRPVYGEAWADGDYYWWHEHDTQIVLDQSRQGEDMTRVEFPTEPSFRESWGSQPSRVTVANRWQSVRVNGTRYHVFYMGQCLTCSRSVWCTADGLTLAEMGSNGLWVVEGEDGQKVRMCVSCAKQSSLRTLAIEQAKTDPNPGPLVWPDIDLASFDRPKVKVAVGGEDDEDDEEDLF